MADKLYFGRLRDGIKLLLGPLRGVFQSSDSSIIVNNGTFEYVLVDSPDYAPAEAIAIYEGVDVSDQVVIEGTVDVTESGSTVLRYYVPDTTPLLETYHTVVVYDPTELDALPAGNIDALIFTDIIEPVIYTTT